MINPDTPREEPTNPGMRDMVEVIKGLFNEIAARDERRAREQVAMAREQMAREERRAQREAERDFQLYRQLETSRERERREHGKELSEGRETTREPVKLRTDGIPQWPAPDGQLLPYFVFAEDFLVWLSMLGYDQVLNADPADPSISDTMDNTALRYLCAAITNQTIRTYLADNFRRQGRAAWRYLQREFGLRALAA